MALANTPRCRLTATTHATTTTTTTTATSIDVAAACTKVSGDRYHTQPPSPPTSLPTGRRCRLTATPTTASAQAGSIGPYHHAGNLIDVDGSLQALLRAQNPHGFLDYLLRPNTPLKSINGFAQETSIIARKAGAGWAWLGSGNKSKEIRKQKRGDQPTKTNERSHRRAKQMGKPANQSIFKYYRLDSSYPFSI